jgi:hypothetical protein
MRFVVLFTVVLMLYGVLRSVNVMNDIAYIKYAQPWLEQRCADAGWLEVAGSPGLYENGTILEYVHADGPAVTDVSPLCSNGLFAFV